MASWSGDSRQRRLPSDPDPPTFPDGRTYVVAGDRELPGGKHHVEIVAANGVRRAVLLEAYEMTPEVLDGIGDALNNHRRIIHGRQLGQGF